MPLGYLDTSALVKRYVPETGSAWVGRFCQHEPVAISLVAITELASSLARRTREGALSSEQRDLLFQVFLRDAQSFTVVVPDRAVAEQAATLLLTVPLTIHLRALDALHLASAQLAFARAQRRGVNTGSFISADRALLGAARWAGLPALNPEDFP